MSVFIAFDLHEIALNSGFKGAVRLEDGYDDLVHLNHGNGLTVNDNIEPDRGIAGFQLQVCGREFHGRRLFGRPTGCKRRAA